MLPNNGGTYSFRGVSTSSVSQRRSADFHNVPVVSQLKGVTALKYQKTDAPGGLFLSLIYCMWSERELKFTGVQVERRKAFESYLTGLEFRCFYYDGGIRAKVGH